MANADDRPSRDRWLVLVATSLGSSLAFLDSSVVHVALPAIREDLELGLSGQQWVVLAYVLALGACYLAAGAVADRIGLRRGFVIGTIGFAVASLVVGAAPDELSMIVARVVQGVAASLLTTTSLALLRVSWAEDSGRAIGLWTSITTASIIAGPPIGGIVVEVASWRWIFLANVPLAIVALLAISRAGKAMGAKLDDAPPRPDLLSLALSTGALALVIGALVETQRLGGAWTGAMVALAMVLLVLTWRRGRAGATPLVPGSLIRRRDFASVILATLLVYAALGAVGFFTSVYLQAATIGYSAFESGMVQMPGTILLLVFAPTFGRLADRHGPRRFLVSGPLLFAASALLMATVDARTIDLVSTAPWIEFDGFDALLPAQLLGGLGLAMLVAPITSTALRAAPDSQSGIASAVSNLAARVGTLLAIAGLGLVASWVWDQSIELDIHVSEPSESGPFSPTSFGFADLVAAADIAAFQTAMIGCAVLATLGALVVFVGLRGTTGVAAAANDPDRPAT